MKKVGDFTFLTACVIWVFWPWLLGILEALRWFFRYPFLLQWDPDRFGMAFLWPIPAVIVLVFLGWIYSALSE